MSTPSTVVPPNELLDRMAKFEEDLKAASAAVDRDTLGRLRTDFTTFKTLVLSYMSMLNSQLKELADTVDSLEMRQRRKCLLFHSVPEKDDEDVEQTVSNICDKLDIPGFSAADCIKSCHRLGAPRDEGHRPILVKFVDIKHKGLAWKKKSNLKGTPHSVAEFLTRPRQAMFIKARKHFGMRQVWTQDGTIHIKPRGSSARYKAGNMSDLDKLMMDFPPVAESDKPDPKKAPKIPRTTRNPNKK